jgi:transcriptional regulator with XRE-family HTH domain
MSQELLGEALGISFQQIQKYEKGVNRIGAGRLLKIAGVLGWPRPKSIPVTSNQAKGRPESCSERPPRSETCRC